MRFSFSAPTAVLAAALLTCVLVFVRYPENAGEQVQQYYPYLRDVLIMIFVGFGFLMTFLRRYSYGAVALNMFVSAVVMVEAILWVGAAQQSIWNSHSHVIILDLPLLIDAAFCAASCMIAFGAFIGKASPTQFLWIAFAQVPLYAVNQHLVTHVFQALDVGGTIVIHAFGAFYGLAASLVISYKQAGLQETVFGGWKRFQYEEEVQRAPLNYDNWFDYIKLEESAGDVERTREVYERAVANLPPGPEKRYWQRYIYLWIKYALWEELDTNEPARAREVYRAALKLVPHGNFTFAKLWIMAAKFEVRQKRVDSARKILGMGIGMAPKERLFKSYIELEGQLGNVDRCRKLYEKYLEWSPANCTAWIKFAEMEKGLGEVGRTRALYELAIAQPVLDIPEGLWKSYIDFEIGEGERGRVRVLYQRLLDRSKHVKVWLSFAQFEAAPMPSPAVDDEDEVEAEAREAAARLAAASGPESVRSRSEAASRVYVRGYSSLRELTPDSKEEAVMLLEAWKSHEAAGAAFRSTEDQAAAMAVVAKHAPRRVKRKRPITTEDGMEVGMEEYIDWIFPEEAGAAPNLKLLQAAYRWKKQKTENTDAAAAAAAANAAVDAPADAGVDAEGASARGGGGSTAAEVVGAAGDDEDDEIEVEDGTGGGGASAGARAGGGRSSPEAGGGDDDGRGGASRYGRGAASREQEARATGVDSERSSAQDHRGGRGQNSEASPS